MRLKAILTSGFLAGALALTPLAAGAATFILTNQAPGNVFGTNGSAGATIKENTIRPGGVAVLAGGFAVKGNLHGTGVENFTAWCLDIGTYLSLPSSYAMTATPFASGSIATRMASIEQLFETGYSTLNLGGPGTAARSAGFQLALWEVLYENSPLDLTKGNFKVTNSAAAIAFGQSLLAGLAGPISQTYDLAYLQSEGHVSQHLVTASPTSPVPLPAGGLLLAGALAGLAAWRRRKAA